MFLGGFMKEYKSYRQLITILRNRGMDIPKGSVGSRVMRILENENYYNVINGYKELFIDKPATAATDESYKPGTTFDEVYALYRFDFELRGTYLKYLLKIENSFKTILSHEFSSKYGHDNYLKLDNFDISSKEKVASVTKLMGDIQQEIARQMNKHHQAVTHYMTKHGYIPLWILVNVLTFGKITAFYLNMKDADRIVIAKKFGINHNELHKYMTLLGIARNKCAHDERFFDIRFRKHLHTKSIKNFSSLGIPKGPGGNYISGTNDAFAITVMFAQMLKKSEFNEFITAINSSINRLSKDLKTINIEEVLTIMGYPSKWKDTVKLI